MQVSNEPADVSTFGAARKCASADDVAGGQAGRRGTGGVSSVRKTPSSPALSRISASGSGGGGGGGRDDAVTAPAQVAETGRPAGRWHDDAHKHHGLPDAIEDAVYRSLQTKRHRHPGLGLDGCWPKCSAVAYKSFNDPGPTQCSKLRVYRPKTSSSSAVPDGGGEQKEPPGRDEPDGRSSRPKTCPTVVQPQHRLTDIKLALCWDLDAPFDRNRPAAGSDEPAVFHKIRRRRSSGGGDDDRKLSQPPQNSSAVMGFVRGDDGNNHCDRDGGVPKNRNLSAVMELIPNKDDSRRADDDDDDGHSKNGAADVCRDDGHDDDRRDDDGNECPPQATDRRGRRGPNAADPDEPRAHGPDRVGRRPCVACDRPDAGRDREPAHEGHYKMAFKAGVPAADEKRAATDRKPDGRRHHQHHHHHRRRGHLKVPKPRTTNSDDKKYVIGTLLPPFSMWPGTTARDYPEHWRLTSVYRQAFKPLELRKQPLLRTIYL